ncbi:MAG: HIT domain-containing protein [Planctomycetes bacterium]|nr:HIT domain-containing protein [Planctomycetota bacterium]
MDRLWAPWRMKYILDNAKAEDCFLCTAAEAGPEEKNGIFLVRRGENALLVMNRYPYNNGHLLAAPLRHAADLTDLTAEERGGLMDMTALAEKLLREVLRPDGFNIGLNVGAVAGAGLPGHVHVHIVPRWESDTNFMPVVADTKVIPQALEELYDKLLAALPGALE